MRRWILRAVLAAAVTAGSVYVYSPPRYVSEQMEVAPARIIGEILVVFAVVFLLIVLGDTIVLWATRKPRTFRVSGCLSLATGVLSALFAISLWFAFLSVITAPIGIAAATVGLRREFKDGEGHSLANLAGLILNVIALGTLASQIITATIWK